MGTVFCGGNPLARLESLAVEHNSSLSSSTKAGKCILTLTRFRGLTLSPLEAGRFFLHPARLPVFLRGERRVEAVCPEAFSSFEEVPVCPTVPTQARRKSMRSPACKIFRAAFSSLSSTNPHPGQMCVLTERLFFTRAPHAEQS